MDITVNGEPRRIESPLTVQQLLSSLNLNTNGGLAVLLNGEVARRANWPKIVLQPDDALEIVRATVGG
ncbi:MAG: sulfur carrier protein ThiS [SAR324 cluster bacterium]|nr:sulfur carrier protein ThiS [SAR324 cluster bacterium]